MEKTKRPSRRDVIAKGVATVGAAVAASTVAAESADERSLKLRRLGRGGLKLNNIPRSRMTPDQLRKDDKARRAALLLRELGTNVEIQWVKGPRLPGKRRIVQIWG